MAKAIKMHAEELTYDSSKLIYIYMTVSRLNIEFRGVIVSMVYTFSEKKGNKK